MLDEDLPHDSHDFTVDYIVTPDEIIACDNPYRPDGLVWEHLTPEQVQAIPVLAEMQRDRHSDNC